MSGSFIHGMRCVLLVGLAAAASCAAEVPQDTVDAADPETQALLGPAQDAQSETADFQAAALTPCRTPYAERDIVEGCCSRNSGKTLHQLCANGYWRTLWTGCGGYCAQ